MRKLMLAAGVATLAMTSPALADRDKQGGGQDNRGGQAAKAERGGKDGGREDRVQRNDDRRPMVVAQGRGSDRKEMKREDHGDSRRDARADRGADRRDVRIVNRALDDDDRVRIVTRRFDDDFVFPGRGRGLINGCPPGLDRKDNGCLPPGQAKRLLGTSLQRALAGNLVPYQYRSWYRDNGDYMYRSDDRYIYRVNRNNSIVDGLIPLFGGGGYYALGDPWPEPYNFYNVPQQYRSYYADTPNYNYRYGDGAIYRVNPRSGVVDSIVALLAGDLGVGSRLPMGYDAYNVPLAHRDRYYDTADNWYRYNDGYIYQVDPKTRLISAVIDAII